MRAQQGDAYSESEAALVARLEALSAETAAAPDEDFRAATRNRLVAMAAVRTPATAATRRPPVQAGRWRRLLAGAPDGPATRWRTRLTAGLAGAALTVTAVGGLLGAAQGARPGDLLYDLKRGGEQTRLALAGDSRRGVTLLGFASTRLDELSELVGVQPDADAVVGTAPSGGAVALAAGPDVGLVLDTLQTMDEQTTEGTAALTSRAVADDDADALQVLSGWATGQQSGLGGLTDAVPTGAEGALNGSRTLVDAVSARSAALEDALACPGGAATAGSDELGPLPAACPSAPPASAVTAPSGASGPSPSDSSGTTGTTATPGQSGSTTAGGGVVTGPSTGTATPAPTTGAGPTGTTPGTAPGGSARTTAPPAGSTTRGLPLPSLPVPSVSAPSLPLPSLPSLSLPGVPPAPTSTTRSPGPVVSVSPLVPGVSGCVPPLIAVGC